MPQTQKNLLNQYFADQQRKMHAYAKEHPEDIIVGYRHDPSQKEGIETQPTLFRKSEIIQTAQAMKDAKDALGARTLAPKDYVNLLLKEGRSNAGFNSLDKNDKEAQAVADQLGQIGHQDIPAGIAAAMFNKLKLADHWKVPFGEAWNGKGKNAYGVTGAQYAKELEAAKPVVDHPANQQLMNTVTSILAPSEWDDNNPTPVPQFKKGGVVMPQEYSNGSWKLI